MIILLEENIAFLKEQINKKDKVIDSLLNQLSKQNNSASHNKTSNAVSTEIELITDSKENAGNSENNSSISSCDINSKSKKSIVILGDSMLKRLNGWEMSEKVKSDCKIL